MREEYEQAFETIINKLHEENIELFSLCDTCFGGAVYFIDTREHDKKIRADERRKFAEWLSGQNAGIVDIENEEWKINTVYKGIESAVTRYEKEQKGAENVREPD